ncbi:MAG: TetR/AcrR family transcriptional regulator [Clostridiales bacterium]|nr:TetR/AcrR family transcriptional regulator [Clostridiales bacterium]
MKELTPRQKKSLDMKKKVYDIFCRLSVEYEGNVTVKDVCREAGISVGSFYNFFESKEAVTAAVYQYLDEEMAAYEYPEDPVERILCAIERVMRLSMAKGIHFLKMATIYEASHTPTIARNDYNGRIFLSTTSDIIISALQNGAEKGVFTFTQPPWYYSDMIILMYRSLLYFWTVNNGQFDSVTPLISYTNYILDSIRTGRK